MFWKGTILVGAAVMTLANGVTAEEAGDRDNQASVGHQAADREASGNGKTYEMPKASASRSGPARHKVEVPEPSNLLMLGLGLAGLIAGRMVARRSRKTNSS
ncbi:PEP-CTERM sorting domain-containing protein [Sphingorhabdus sp. SMR4y]|uniref:PEP-CTERM sorting domain-containing protein n=1 Tax=Sphingorhabdus sp. SMR4y TaxID=2584094 RepID=UPI000B5E8809|nr:PEP-CTERM sorting domain-containing protein [Sphingorhabdus sp. SMR4y]ASK89823.1 PEP-CTERM motif protein [Sphingorhabdus sp. SMR4y]